ncbi:MAG: LPS export ABC transporter periplasmic protein LptC [Ignavibacteria bacterium]|nr:LPS export ABC transporter periplasmic protein LptC [Ignavibacteria bacterium]
MRLAPYLVLVSLAVIALGCTQKTAIQRSADDPFLVSPAHIAYNVKIRFTDTNRTKAVLYARQGIINEQSQTTIARGNVVVDFYNGAGNLVQARLTADSVVIDDRTRNMTAFGRVKVESKVRRVTLTTTALTWVQATARIRTDAAVHIETDSETIDGQGMESNQDLSSFRLFQVRGVRHKT